MIAFAPPISSVTPAATDTCHAKLTHGRSCPDGAPVPTRMTDTTRPATRRAAPTVNKAPTICLATASQATHRRLASPLGPHLGPAATELTPIEVTRPTRVAKGVMRQPPRADIDTGRATRPGADSQADVRIHTGERNSEGQEGQCPAGGHTFTPVVTRDAVWQRATAPPRTRIVITGWLR